MTFGRRRDDGFTLLETIVSMMLMSVFGALFTSAIVLMNSSSNKAESLTVVSGQLDQGFETLDKTVRYAATITTPGQGTSGDWYVEYQTAYGSSQTCTQLRVDIPNSQLQSRSWVSGAAGTATAWTPLASGITNGAAAAGTSTQPFVLGTGVGVVLQQLTINLESTSGVAGQTTKSSSSVTFTALNSANPASNVCGEAGRP